MCPTLTFADGTTLTWDVAPLASPTFATLSVAPDSVMSTSPSGITAGLSSQPTPPEPTSPVTQADVQTALARVPPKWTATFMRFTKTLLAGSAAAIGVAWVSTGGTISGVLGDPQTFLVALGTALLMALHKALTWKPEV